MSEIDAKLVKQLRDKTNAGMMDCRRALQESGGDLAEAEIILRKRGIASAQKKATRATGEGVIGSYIHGGGRVGVLVEINCETDFVARNESFRELVRDVAMQVAATSPQYVSSDQVPAEIVEREKEIALAQLDPAKREKLPPATLEGIARGKVDKFFEATCLMNQEFIKDADQKQKRSIKALVDGKIAELGENIVIRRFSRFALGDA